MVKLDLADKVVFEFLKTQHSFIREEKIAKTLDWDLEKVKDCMTALDAQDIVMYQVVPKNNADSGGIEWKLYGFDVIKQAEKLFQINGDYLKKTKQGTKVVTGLLAEKLMQEDEFKTMEDTHEVFYYGDGVYIPGENFVLNKCQGLLGADETKTLYVNESLSYIQRKTFTGRNEFDKNPFIINLKNGLFDIKKGGLKNHDEKYLSLLQVDINGIKDAKCEMFEKFLYEILPNEIDRLTMQEWFGYCLFREYKFNEILVLVGGGSNGKSTLLAVLTKMLGHSNVAAVSLKELSEDKFAVAGLFNKMANIVPDLPNDKIMSTGNIKTATGGVDLMRGQKKFGHGFEFKNHAKFIFACNEVPETKDDTDANYRRWGYIDFTEQFEGDNADKDIFEKITTEEEMEGVLRWSIEGLKRLLTNEKFSNHKSIEERREETVKRSKSVHYYAEQMLDLDSGAHVEKADLFEDYNSFCKEHEIMPKTKIAFGRDVGEAVPAIRSSRRGEAGDRYTAWVGVKFIDGKTIETGKNVSCHRWDHIPKSSMTHCNYRDNNSGKCQGCHRFSISNRIRDKEINNNNNCKLDDLPIVEQKCKNKYDTYDNPQESRVRFLLLQIKGREKNFDRPVDKKILIDEYQIKKFSIEQLEKDIETLKKDGIIYEPKDGRYKIV